MLHISRITAHLSLMPGVCDDCLANELDIYPRQTVYRLCSRSPLVQRSTGSCRACGKSKIIRSLNDVTANPLPLPKAPRAGAPRAYFRELDLQAKFNKSIATSLKLEDVDYYGRLTFEDFVYLKSGLARVNDIITYRLTLALVDRIGSRLALDFERRVHLAQKIHGIHPNAAGFDLDSTDPNIVGEVKSNIPVNAGATFGAAQLRGLTNDVRQMFALPASGKQEDKLSQRSKIRRAHLATALKFLGLYDSPQIRAATEHWRRPLLKTGSWGGSRHLAIEELPENGPLSPNTVYLVFLNPSTST